MLVKDGDVALEPLKPSVQVYAITGSNGEYDLLGHGFVSINSEQQQSGGGILQVKGRLNGNSLVQSRIRADNAYEKQKGSVIIWVQQQPNPFRDLAISFQNEGECDFYWRIICARIGKNYLDINSKETLEMPNQFNLPYVLEKTKNLPDMVQYHIINSQEFMTNLHKVFLSFRQREDKMGMGTVSRILSAILTNVDNNLALVLFKDPNFSIILQIQQFVFDIDFLLVWQQKLLIKPMIPLTPDISNRIQIYHRVNFYRENILDLTKEFHFEQILLMINTDSCRDIIHHLTDSNAIEDLLQLKALPGDMEWGEREIAEKKMEFIMQALIICKQVGNESIRSRFLVKIYKSGVMKLILNSMQADIPRSLDLLICIAQTSPLKLMQFLKTNFREHSSQGLYVKLFKKYCSGSEQIQLSILEVIKYLGEPFKNKQNLDFFIGTFLTFAFENSKDKALLNLLADMLVISQKSEPILLQAVKNKVFGKLNYFGRTLRHDKVSELKIAKIIKTVLLENAGSNADFQKAFLAVLNEQVVGSGLFECSMLLLEKQVANNNVVSSSLLENLKIIRITRTFTPYHTFLQQNYQNKPALQKYLTQILNFRPVQAPVASTHSAPHQRDLEQQQQQSYLLSENIQDLNPNTMLSQQTKNQLQQLKRIRQQIQSQSRERELQDMMGIERITKKRKMEEEPVTIQFNLSFDQFIEGNQ